jgi:membrane protease YdiL (CAAX protease family)
VPALLCYLLLSFGWSWGFLLLAGEAGVFAAAFGPLLGALGGVLLEHGRAGPGVLWRRLGPLSVGWATWLLAVYAVVPFAIVCLLLFGAADLRETGGTAAILLFMPFLAVFSLLPGPIGEEVGWRGVLLPWLLGRWQPLPASLWLGLLWSVWHAPLWWQPEFRLGAPLWLFAPLYTVSLLAMSVIISAIYLRAGGSVVLAMVTHAALNAAVGPFALVHARGHLAAEAVLPVTLTLCLTAAALWLGCGAAAARAKQER